LNEITVKHFFVELKTLKFSLALGLAFAAGFLLYNLIFLLVGDNFSIAFMDIISHKRDFKPDLVKD